MFVRRTRVEGSPEEIEQLIQTYEEQLLPVMKQRPGFRGPCCSSTAPLAQASL